MPCLEIILTQSDGESNADFEARCAAMQKWIDGDKVVNYKRRVSMFDLDQGEARSNGEAWW